MSILTTRELRRHMERENAKQPAALRHVPIDEWPPHLRGMNGAPQIVWRSRDFLVQEYHAAPPVLVRLSVNRTTLSGDRWADNITWDELQRIKAECGYQHGDAVEVYPALGDEVNVANMRHLWVLREQLSFAWRNCYPPAGERPLGAG